MISCRSAWACSGGSWLTGSIALVGPVELVASEGCDDWGVADVSSVWAASRFPRVAVISRQASRPQRFGVSEVIMVWLVAKSRGCPLAPVIDNPTRKRGITDKSLAHAA